MSAEAVIFYVFAVITVGASAIVVLARSLIYSAFALLFAFFGVAGLYVLLGADFLAATQLLIYVGGILVLLLFGVMLTHKLYDLDLKSEVTQFLPGLIVSARHLRPARPHRDSDAVGHRHRPPPGGDDRRHRPAVHEQLPAPLRGRLRAAPGRAHGRGHDRAAPERRVSGEDPMISLQHYLVVSAALFALGILGVLTRRNAVNVLMGVELILNSANLNLVAFSRYGTGNLQGQLFAVFVIVIAAAEVAVALAIVLTLYRLRRTPNLDEADFLRG